MRWRELIAATAVACAATRPLPTVPPVAVVVSEAWNGGSRLVLVDARGDRWGTIGAGELGSRDEQAVVSPDGRWVAFVSTRGRDDDRTSLWLVPAAAGATPVRLTDGRREDIDPTWTPDGGAIVFARRVADSFALCRVAVRGETAALAVGELEVLTAGAAHQVAPSVAASGEIVYQEIDPTRGHSRLALRAVDGSVTFLTDGPLDATPAWRPGTSIVAFARQVERPDGDRDLELWQLDGDPDADHAPTAIVDLPLTDDSGPRWSRDGRWLFATAVARTADDVVTAVVYLDILAPVPRMLRDSAGAAPRQGPAPVATTLDATALAAGPRFDEALVAMLAERAFTRSQAAADAGVDASAR